MKQRTLIAAVAAVSVLGWTAYAEHDEAKANTSGSFDSVQRGSRLLGIEVRDSSDKKAGEVDDLVVDLETGRVLYAVVDLGRNKVALPPGVFNRVTSSEAHVDVSREKIDSAPKFTSEVGSKAELNRASFVSQVHRHFGQNEWWQGNTPADRGTFNNTHKLTDLRAAKVVNVQDQEMGKISNMAIDLPAGRIVYVLLGPDQSLDLGNALYALPPSLLTQNTKYEDTTFSANIDRAKLAAGPHFNRDNWSRLSDRAWAANVYSHYGKQAYFDASGALAPTGRDTSTVRSQSSSRTSGTDQVIGRERNNNRGWNRGRTVDNNQTSTTPQSQDNWDLDSQRK
jgi:sporulation protein YlmC with PRC-barrel domain